MERGKYVRMTDAKNARGNRDNDDFVCVLELYIIHEKRKATKPSQGHTSTNATRVNTGGPIRSV